MVEVELGARPVPSVAPPSRVSAPSVVIDGRPALRQRATEFVALTWTLSRKNFQVRYKRAALGVGWAVLQPALQAAILSYIFVHVFAAGRGVPHYPVYVLSGLLPWVFFTQAVNAATASVLENSSLLKKVAIPQLIYPLAATGGTLIAFSAATVILLVAGLAVHSVGISLLLLPLALALELLTIVGVTAVTSSLFPAFRDVRYLVESVLMVGIYATPVLYRPTSGGRVVRTVISINPLTGVLDLYRSAFLSLPVPWGAVGESLGVGLVVLAVGLTVFHARAGEFADLV